MISKGTLLLGNPHKNTNRTLHRIEGLKAQL
jgi:hypothetical protein